MKKITINNARELSIDDIRKAYKQYLNDQGFSQNTIMASSTDAFYLWKKGSNDLFWDSVTSNDFEAVSKNALFDLLHQNSSGNVKSNLNGYMAHLRRFRRFLFEEECTIPERKPATIYKENQKSTSLSIEEAIKNIEDYFGETLKDKHGRYMSWQHCYKVFLSSRNTADEKMIDYLSLHMAFYLASWGMYRGSSFLLKKDYKVHIPIVKIIMNEKYNPLAEISAEGLLDERNLDLLDDISSRLREAYADEKPSFDGVTNNATDTLITKILLAALGCVPAYDRYYIQAVKQYGISSGNYNRDSVKDVAAYYIANKELLEAVRVKLNTCDITYPPMKLMDMCMWQAAYIEGEE